MGRMTHLIAEHVEFVVVGIAIGLALVDERGDLFVDLVDLGAHVGDLARRYGRLGRDHLAVLELLLVRLDLLRVLLVGQVGAHLVLLLHFLHNCCPLNNIRLKIVIKINSKVKNELQKKLYFLV